MQRVASSCVDWGWVGCTSKSVEVNQVAEAGEKQFEARKEKSEKEEKERLAKGLASYCKAETTFTFYLSILTLSNAFLGIDNREMKSESGFSFAIASQPFQ